MVKRQMAENRMISSNQGLNPTYSQENLREKTMLGFIMSDNDNKYTAVITQNHL